MVKDLRRIPVHVEEPSLDVPALQMVEQPAEVVKFFSKSFLVIAEQVIEVPLLALLDGFLQRVVPLEPQMAEQLVEVPTVQCFVEQTVNLGVLGGFLDDGGLQGLLPETEFLAIFCRADRRHSSFQVVVGMAVFKDFPEDGTER